MTVESLKSLEGNADKFMVRFEDGTELKVGSAQIADFSLYTGRELTAEEYEGLRGTLEQNTSKTRALRILGSRNLSAREIEKRLKSKGDSQETAQQTVEWLENAGLVNDAEYATNIVSHYSAKGYGPARVKDELYKRGIPRELMDEAMNSIESDDEAAFSFIRKKLGEDRDRESINKTTAALYRRGFSYEDARDAVRRYIENSEGSEQDQ